MPVGDILVDNCFTFRPECGLFFSLLCLSPGRFQGVGIMEDFRSPMVLAGLSGSVECLKLLLDEGMQIRQEALMLLSTAGCL